MDFFDVRKLTNERRTENESEIRGRCASAYLGDYEILARCLGRYKMFLDTRDIGFAPHILLDGYWEYWTTQFITRYLRPGMSVLDVGANFGYFSLLMADLIGPQGSCIAIEPNPSAAAKLEKTLSVNGFNICAIRNVALSDREGSVVFFVPRGEPKNARIMKEAPIGDGETIDVPCTSIDSIASTLDRLDFIKIDAEGAEADIVDGMHETMKRLKPALLIEYNAGRNYDAIALVEQLAGFGHPLRYVDFDGHAKQIDKTSLLSRNVGEDWMLFIGP